MENTMKMYVTAATLKELELMFDADELIIFEFTNPYLDLEQKNACA